MLLCRLYLGLIQTMNDDYGAEFAKHSGRFSEGLLLRRLHTAIARPTEPLGFTSFAHPYVFTGSGEHDCAGSQDTARDGAQATK
jgi:hypothetical protein